MVRALTILVFALGWIPIFALRSEPLRAKLAAGSAPERRWIPATVVAVTVHVVLAEVMLSLPQRFPLPTWRLAAGLATFATGIGWWTWARHRLVPLGERLDPAEAPTQLIVTGPFAVVRHPLALGMLIVALGPAVTAGAAATWLTFAAVVVCLAQRCRQDEEALRREFGSTYTRYAARTWRLVPFVW